MLVHCGGTHIAKIACAPGNGYCGWNGYKYACGTDGGEDPSSEYPKQCLEKCFPNCSGKECGDDGCGGSCGICPESAECVDGKCEGDEPIEEPQPEPYPDEPDYEIIEQNDTRKALDLLPEHVQMEVIEQIDSPTSVEPIERDDVNLTEYSIQESVNAEEAATGEIAEADPDGASGSNCNCSVEDGWARQTPSTGSLLVLMFTALALLRQLTARRRAHHGNFIFSVPAGELDTKKVT